MVRVLFLQALYNLSDENTERQLLDRRSFQRFCGLADELRIPDARTVWLFKQRLAQGGMGARTIFDAVLAGWSHTNFVMTSVLPW